jgi:hypothetical protein
MLRVPLKVPCPDSALCASLEMISLSHYNPPTLMAAWPKDTRLSYKIDTYFHHRQISQPNNTAFSLDLPRRDCPTTNHPLHYTWRREIYVVDEIATRYQANTAPLHLSLPISPRIPPAPTSRPVIALPHTLLSPIPHEWRRGYRRGGDDGMLSSSPILLPLCLRFATPHARRASAQGPAIYFVAVISRRVWVGSDVVLGADRLAENSLVPNIRPSYTSCKMAGAFSPCLVGACSRYTIAVPFHFLLPSSVPTRYSLDDMLSSSSLCESSKP